MITSTFRHLTGVGAMLEERFWREGYFTWEAALMAAELPCRRHENRIIREQLQESCRRFAAGDALWFSSRLDSADQWRLYGDFRSSCAYVDIETTGLSSESCAITTICLWDGAVLRSFVRGRNLEDFPEALKQYSLLVTFNGRAFDVPFIEHAFDISVEMAHLDLRWAFKPLGFIGGLKRIEQALGHRRPGLEGVDGRAAVYLWEDYELTGDPAALETLLAYNAEDAMILEPLAVYAYTAYVRGLSLSMALPLVTLPAPVRVRGPFTPSPEVLRRLGGG